MRMLSKDLRAQSVRKYCLMIQEIPQIWNKVIWKVTIFQKSVKKICKKLKPILMFLGF